AQVRGGHGPRLLHAKTYRSKGHVSVDPAAYRDPRELAAAMSDDPLLLAQRRLVERGVANEAIEARMRAARDAVAAAPASAAAAARPAAPAPFGAVQAAGSGRWFS